MILPARNLHVSGIFHGYVKEPDGISINGEFSIVIFDHRRIWPLVPGCDGSWQLRTGTSPVLILKSPCVRPFSMWNYRKDLIRFGEIWARKKWRLVMFKPIRFSISLNMHPVVVDGTTPTLKMGIQSAVVGKKMTYYAEMIRDWEIWSHDNQGSTLW